MNINLTHTGEKTASPILPYLEITWHKFGEIIYCHRAKLFFNSSEDEKSVRIDINIKNWQYQDKKNPISFDESMWAYLPCNISDNIVCVPLDSTNLVESLEINEWTQAKDKTQSKIKRCPIEISWIFGNQTYKHSFIQDGLFSPVLICEPFFSCLKDGEKLTASISLNAF